MHLANCNEHPDGYNPKLSCWQLRHDDGRKVTPDEAMAEIDRLRSIFRANILRLAPETRHEEIDRILAGEPHH